MFVIFQLVLIGMTAYIVWDIFKDTMRKRRLEKKLYKENKHDKEKVFGLGFVLKDKETTDAEKVAYMKELLDILDGD